MLTRVVAALTSSLLAVHAGEAQRERLHVTWGIHGSYPEHVSAAIGINSIRTTTGDEQRGAFLVLEPGLNGGRISIGQVRGYENGLWSTHFGLLQTWNSPPGMRAGLTYLNTEQRVTFEWFQVGLGFGYLVAGGESTTPVGIPGQRGGQSLIITGVLGAHFTF